MPVATVNLFTLKEVAETGHGKNGSPVWLIYKYSVYDCTTYLHKHPGDPQLILEFAGRDCTKDFDDVGHSLDAMKEMRTLKIGEIVEVSFLGVVFVYWFHKFLIHKKMSISQSDRINPKKNMSTQSITSLVSTDSEKKRRRRFLLCRWAKICNNDQVCDWLWSLGTCDTEKKRSSGIWDIVR